MTPLLLANKRGTSSWRVVQGVTRRGMGALVCHAVPLMNSFFSLCTVATLTLVSFDVTLMLQPLFKYISTSLYSFSFCSLVFTDPFFLPRTHLPCSSASFLPLLSLNAILSLSNCAKLDRDLYDISYSEQFKYNKGRYINDAIRAKMIADSLLKAK